MADQRPFSGIRVLDFTRVLAGPFCAYQLGLLGADVIKIEPPGRGETVRWRTEADPSFGRSGMSVSFMTQSANKRFVALDVDRPEGREIFLKLAAGADVVVQNLRTGSAGRRGIGYEEVKAVNPKAIFCSITAYGNTGPKQSAPAYDSVIQAVSGLMSVTGTPDSAPLKAGPPIIDYATGLAAAFAVASALYQRSRTDEGQYIDLSMLDAALILMASTVTVHLNTGSMPKPAGNDASSRAPASTTFNTREGLIALAINEEHQYQNLLKTLGLEALNRDPRFAQPAERDENRDALRAALQQALMTRPATEWEMDLNAAGVPAGRVRTIPEAMSDAQVESRQLFHAFPAAATGFGRELKVPLTPFRLAHGAARADTPPRAVGADTDAVLRELGYGTDAIRGLRERGVI